MDVNEEPIVCDLSTSTAKRQLLEWSDLHAISTDITATDHGAVLRFPLKFKARIEDLTEREAACCAFLDFDTTIADDEFVVQITSDNPDGIPIVEILAGVKI